MTSFYALDGTFFKQANNFEEAKNYFETYFGEEYNGKDISTVPYDCLEAAIKAAFRKLKEKYHAEITIYPDTLEGGADMSDYFTDKHNMPLFVEVYYALDDETLSQAMVFEFTSPNAIIATEVPFFTNGKYDEERFCNTVDSLINQFIFFATGE